MPVQDETVDLEELRSFCRADLAGYKLPKNLRLLDTIPLTANSKPDRRRVRAEALVETAGTSAQA